MSGKYEFRHQTTGQLMILGGIRSIIVISLLLYLYGLVSEGYPGLANALEDVGAVCTLIWIYCNVIQVKVEIQELFVPPFNTLNGIEFMLLGFFCFMAATYLRLTDILG